MPKPILSDEERWFANRLSLSLKANVPLLQAIGFLCEEAAEANPTLAADVESVRRHVESGQPIHQALVDSQTLSSTMLAAMCRAGEISGELGETMSRTDDYATHEAETWREGEPDAIGHLHLWMRRTGLMLTSGVPVLRTLESSVDGEVPDALREAVLFARAALRSGEPLSAALAEHPEVFSPTVRRMVWVGEYSGSLDQVCLQIADHLRSGVTLPGLVSDKPKPAPAKPLSDESSAANDWEEIARRVDDLLVRALDARATDLHLQAGRHESRLRMRVDGELRTVETITFEEHKRFVNRLKTIAGISQQQQAEPNTGALHLRAGDHDCHCRVTTYPTLYGEAVAIRLPHGPQANGTHASADETLSSLGMSSEHIETVEPLLRQPNGILVVTGPVGAGRTTTLHCLARHAVERGAAVFAIERATEGELPGVRQVKLEPDRGLDATNALRAIMRQDPDVLTLGESPAQETWPLVVETAASGHYLMLPWQAGDAAAAMSEIATAMDAPTVAATTLTGVLSQRLVRRLCPDCARERDLTQAELQQVPPDHPLLAKPRTLESPGCDACDGTGVAGRFAVFEVAPVSDSVRRGLASGEDAATLRRRLRAEGVTSQRWEALLRVAERELGVAEALRVTTGEE